MANAPSEVFRRVGTAASRHARWVAGFWVVALIAMNVLVPQLERVIADNSAAFIPESNAASQALKQMAMDFGNPDSSAVGFFVMADESGFGDQDRAYYNELTSRLVDADEHVAYIMDLQSTPEARELNTSDDGKAVTLMVVLYGGNGTTEATHATSVVREIAASIEKPDGLEVKFTGPVATTSDQLEAVDHSMVVITGASVIMISIALFFAYRRVRTVAVALVLLGVSLGIARPVVGALGQAGILEMSMFTAALMTALVIGAGTDYAVFIIGRYHEARRKGLAVQDAAADAVGGIATVIIASGLTIAAACLAMLFTEVGIFRTAGPPIAVGIVMSLFVALTLGPALLTLLGRNGGADPLVHKRAARTPEQRWRRVGARVVRKPLPAFFLSIAVLIPMVAVAFTHETNFDEFRAQPSDSESNLGYALAAQHFPYNEVLPEYLIIRSDEDLRGSTQLAALEHIAQSVSQVEGVGEVRSITRPDGVPLPEASLGYQAGLIADGLSEATGEIAAARPELSLLVAGTEELARGARTARDRVPALVAGTDQLAGLAREILDTVDYVEAAVRAASGGTMDLSDAVAEMHTVADGLNELARVMSENAAAVKTSSGLLETVFGRAVSGSPCGVELQCAAVREALNGADRATGGDASAAIRAALNASRNYDADIARIKILSTQMREVSNRLTATLSTLDAQGSSEGLRAKLVQLTSGVRQLDDGINLIANGSQEIADGTREIPGTLEELDSGLQTAIDYLGGIRQHAAIGSAAGFYLPDFAFEEPRFVTASQFFLSPDGKTARMLVLTDREPLSHEAFDRVDAIKAAAYAAAENTVLEGVEISSTGFASVYSDLEDEINRDFTLVAIIALTAVTLVLVVMLRSIVAPIVIMVWAVVSYIAAVGIGVAVWQHVFGVSLHWSVIPISFVLLVGVGADYSMLVISRIREEAALTRNASGRSGGLELGVIRALGATGAVITTAGIVFAVTMFALMSGELYLLAQLGFVVGVGMILDILLVRTVLVPSTLLLLGRTAWWPARS